MNSLYINNDECLQKIIHVSRPKLEAKYGYFSPNMREYTTLVYYDKTTKIARFEVAITHPDMDRFTRKTGREEVMKKLVGEVPYLLMDLKNLVRTMGRKAQKELINHLLSEFTHVLIPHMLAGKK
jgi:hypothetical protein